MSDSNSLHSFACSFSGLFLVILLFFTNKHLRLKEVLSTTYFFTIAVFIYFLFTFKIPQTHGEKVAHWVLPLPMYVMTLYIPMNNYIRNKYDRYLRFYYGLRTPDVSWREFLFQGFLIFSCAIILTIVYETI